MGRAVDDGRVDRVDCSIVVCTHDGAHRLPPVIDALRRQQVPPEVTWEVVVVDNASVDGTADIVRAHWGDDGPRTLRVVHEPRLGLAHARARGIEEARGQVLSFVDDDNVVDASWVRRVVEVLEAHPEAGAVGGRARAVGPGPLPDWFAAVAPYLAVGPQGEPGDVTDRRGYLYGAGLTLRREALDEVLAHGALVLEGRRGDALTLGEDAELGYRLAAAGWRLRYEPDLTLDHVMTPHRLERPYLRRLVAESARTEVLLEPLRLVRRSGVRLVLQRRWWLQALRETVRCVRGTARWLRSGRAFPEELRLRGCWVRLRTLVRLRGRFDHAVAQVLGAPRGAAVLPVERR